MAFFYGLFLIVSGIICIKHGITTIKTQRTFWYAPNFSGFKDRNDRKSSKPFSFFLGGNSILFGIIALVSGTVIIVKLF